MRGLRGERGLGRLRVFRGREGECCFWCVPSERERGKGGQYAFTRHWLTGLPKRSRMGPHVTADICYTEASL